MALLDGTQQAAVAADLANRMAGDTAAAGGGGEAAKAEGEAAKAEGEAAKAEGEAAKAAGEGAAATPDQDEWAEDEKSHRLFGRFQTANNARKEAQKSLDAARAEVQRLKAELATAKVPAPRPAAPAAGPAAPADDAWLDELLGKAPPRPPAAAASEDKYEKAIAALQARHEQEYKALAQRVDAQETDATLRVMEAEVASAIGKHPDVSEDLVWQALALRPELTAEQVAEAYELHITEVYETRRQKEAEARKKAAQGGAAGAAAAAPAAPPRPRGSGSPAAATNGGAPSGAPAPPKSIREVGAALMKRLHAGESIV